MPKFDPYHKWFGIPPKLQPPNHYRLLGVEKFEDDLDVVANAAEQRIAYVKTYELGQYSGRFSEDSERGGGSKELPDGSVSQSQLRRPVAR